QDRLIDAALSLVDEEGDEALSMRALAGRVDRQVSSLYNHVSGRSEVIELMRARIVAEIDVSAFASADSSGSGVAWDEARESWARSYPRAFAAPPNPSRPLAAAPIRAPRPDELRAGG